MTTEDIKFLTLIVAVLATPLASVWLMTGELRKERALLKAELEAQAIARQVESAGWIRHLNARVDRMFDGEK